jgi:proteasome accessory factor B
MAGNKEQLIRLAYIHDQLRAGKYPTAKQLARGFSVKFNLGRDLTGKTIYRDIRFLKESRGAPIEFDPDRNGYYYTEANWKLEALELSEGELFAFYVAETAMKAYAGTPLADYLARAFDRMAAMLPEKANIWTRDLATRVSFASAPVKPIEKKVWDVIEKALKDEITVRIAYRPWNDKPQDRDVDPYHIFSWQGDWYLVAFCRLRKEMRTFKISRIVGAEPTTGGFSRPADFSIDKYLGDAFRICRGDKPRNVKVRFRAKVAPWIREKLWHPKQKLKEEKGGGVVLEFPASHLDEVFGWVMSWGAAAKVIEPKELRDRVREEAREMAKS